MATVEVPNIFRYGIATKGTSVFEEPVTCQSTSEFIGQVTFNADSIVKNLTSTGVEGFQLPVGLSSDRPIIDPTGYIRFNSETGDFEGHNSTQWISLGALTGDVTLGPNLTIIAPDTGDTGSRIRLTKPPTSTANDAIVEIVKTLNCDSVLRATQNNKISWESCEDGEVAFYYNGLKSLETSNIGVNIYNGINSINVVHDGSKAFLNNNGIGNLSVRSSTNNTGVDIDGTNSVGNTITGASVETAMNNIYFNAFYNGVSKLQTTDTGVDIFGKVNSENLIPEANINADNVQLSVDASATATATDIAGISFNKPLTNVQLYHLDDSSGINLLKIRKTDGTTGSVYSELNKPSANDTNALPYTATTNNNNGGDIDTFFLHGVYRIFNAIGTFTGTNIISGDNDLLLIVYSFGDANNITQRVINSRIANSEFTRTRISGTFSDWNGIALTDAGTF